MALASNDSFIQIIGIIGIHKLQRVRKIGTKYLLLESLLGRTKTFGRWFHNHTNHRGSIRASTHEVSAFCFAKALLKFYMRLSTRIFCAVEGFDIFSLPEGHIDLISTFDVSKNGHPVNQVVVCGWDTDEAVGDGP